MLGFIRVATEKEAGKTIKFFFCVFIIFTAFCYLSLILGYNISVVIVYHWYGKH